MIVLITYCLHLISTIECLSYAQKPDAAHYGSKVDLYPLLFD